MKKIFLSAILLVLNIQFMSAQDDPTGYGITPKQTPLLPDAPYVVHDGNRPQPNKATPGDIGKATCSVPPPSDATVLFDGKDLSKWRDGEGDHSRPVDWIVQDNVFIVNPASKVRMIETVEQFGDMQLHLEWRIPADRKLDGQKGSNSGVFLMGIYEIQILSTYNNRTYPDGQAAAIYGQYPPLVNASRPQGEWESYDIIFTTPKFAQPGNLLSPAYVTILQNGVVVHNHKALLGPTGHRVLTKYEAHGATGPIKLQNHDDPIEFRNIWVRKIGTYDTGKTPAELQLQ